MNHNVHFHLCSPTPDAQVEFSQEPHDSQTPMHEHTNIGLDSTPPATSSTEIQARLTKGRLAHLEFLRQANNSANAVTAELQLCCKQLGTTQTYMTHAIETMLAAVQQHPMRTKHE